MKSQEITGKYTTVRIEIPKIEFREYKENMESYVDQTEEFDIKIMGIIYLTPVRELSRIFP